MPEMLKLSGNNTVPFLTRCFNKVFTDGTYREEWTRAVIIPLHQKSDLENPYNYLFTECNWQMLLMRVEYALNEWTKVRKSLNHRLVLGMDRNLGLGLLISFRKLFIVIIVFHACIEWVGKG